MGCTNLHVEVGGPQEELSERKQRVGWARVVLSHYCIVLPLRLSWSGIYSITAQLIIYANCEQLAFKYYSRNKLRKM